MLQLLLGSVPFKLLILLSKDGHGELIGLLFRQRGVTVKRSKAKASRRTFFWKLGGGFFPMGSSRA